MATHESRMQLLWELAREYAIRHVEEKAKEILVKRPEFIEFIVDTGDVCFTKESPDVIGRIDEIPSDEVPEAEELEKFLIDWDERLEITNRKMRVMREGAVLTEGDTYAHMPISTRKP